MYTYPQNEWMKIDIIIDWSQRKVKLYVNLRFVDEVDFYYDKNIAVDNI